MLAAVLDHDGGAVEVRVKALNVNFENMLDFITPVKIVNLSV